MKVRRFRILLGGFLAVIGLLSALGLAPRKPHGITFPKDFLWGAATAAHQVEGGNTNNDWYEWEQAGHTRHPSGDAADHYNRYAADFDLAASLAHNSHRLSVEWSRIEPEQGVFDQKVLDHYRDVLKAARARGLKTFVTLHHFTNPLWASRQGGWSNNEMPRWFAEYTAQVVQNMGDLVDYWITINEMNVTTLTGYVAGATPPGLKDTAMLAPVISNFLKGHAAAYHIIHAFYPAAQVGIAHHMRIFEGARWWNPLDHLIAGWVDDLWNNQILRAMKTGRIKLYLPFMVNYDETWPELEGTMDYVGINYYTRDRLAFDLKEPNKFRKLSGDYPTEWDYYPKGMYKVIMKAASFGLPVYITENGLDDGGDKTRKTHLCAHLKEMGNAMEDGADVRGYLHWALIDNFEWVYGFDPRFGLIEVDYATQERKIRPSAEVFKRIIQQGSLEECD